MMSTGILFPLIFGLLQYFSATECACPSGWTSHGDACYYRSSQATNWDGALAKCASLGGTLAEVEAYNDGHYLHNLAKLNGGEYWIALRYAPQQSQWLWHYSQTALSSSLVDQWGYNQPDNPRLTKNCVYVESVRGHWDTGACSETRGAFCRIRPAPPTGVVG